MPEKANWIDRYQDSDHHTDRLVRTKTSYEDKTGLSFPDPDPRETKEMRGRRFRCCEPGMVVVTRRAHSVPPSLLDVHYDFGLGSASRKAQRLSDYISDDHDSIRLASRRHDDALMRDITNRMYRMEFDSVKPGLDVSMKTGFRRHIYCKKRAPLEEETKEERRMDKLRYPWDYTKDNLYRSKPKSPKGQQTEAPKDPYPEHDPLGLYRPRPQKSEKTVDESGAPTGLISRLNVSDGLYGLIALPPLVRRKRDTDEDLDFTIRSTAPHYMPNLEPKHFAPRMDHMYRSPDHYYDEDQVDPLIKKKISDSKADLAEFDQMLDANFGRRRHLMTYTPASFIRGVRRSRARSNLAMDTEDDGYLEGLGYYSEEAGDYGRSRQVHSRTIRASSPPAMSTSVYHDLRHRRASSVPPCCSDADYYDFDIRREPLRHYSHYSPYWHYEVLTMSRVSTPLGLVTDTWNVHNFYWEASSFRSRALPLAGLRYTGFWLHRGDPRANSHILIRTLSGFFINIVPANEQPHCVSSWRNATSILHCALLG